MTNSGFIKWGDRRQIMGLVLTIPLVFLYISVFVKCIFVLLRMSHLNQIHLPLFFLYSCKDKCRLLLWCEICKKNSLVSVVGSMRLIERSALDHLSSSVVPKRVSNELDSLAAGNVVWSSIMLCFTFSVASNSSFAKQQAELEDTTKLDASWSYR